MFWLARQASKARQLSALLPGPQPLALVQVQFSSVFHRLPGPSAELFTALLPSSCSQCYRFFTSSPPPSVIVKESGTDFRNIYTFRFIVHTRVVSQLKMYQTLLTLVAIPPAVSMHSSEALSTLGLASFFGIASVATVMLYVMSNLFRHVVGIVAVNDKEGLVRISRLTFWGRRRDEVFDVSSIVPLSDMSVKADDIYQVIQFYDRPVKFYWFLRHARQADPDAIEKIFGKI